MPDPQTISADYTLRPSELAEVLAVLVRARQPCMVWGGPGCGKSQIANQTADRLGYRYIDIRGPLLDPVDLRGIHSGRPRATYRHHTPDPRRPSRPPSCYAHARSAGKSRGELPDSEPERPEEASDSVAAHPLHNHSHPT